MSAREPGNGMVKDGGAAWRVVPSPTDPEMFAVQGVYLVADHLPIEDARLIAAAPALLEALETLEASLTRDMGAGYAGVSLCQAILAKAEAGHG